MIFGPDELRKVRLITAPQRPEVEDRREGPHTFIERFQTKGFLQRTIWLGATVLAATGRFRAANIHILFNALSLFSSVPFPILRRAQHFNLCLLNIERAPRVPSVCDVEAGALPPFA